MKFHKTGVSTIIFSLLFSEYLPNFFNIDGYSLIVKAFIEVVILCVCGLVFFVIYDTVLKAISRSKKTNLLNWLFGKLWFFNMPLYIMINIGFWYIFDFETSLFLNLTSVAFVCIIIEAYYQSIKKS